MMDINDVFKEIGFDQNKIHPKIIDSLSYRSWLVKIHWLILLDSIFKHDYFLERIKESAIGLKYYADPFYDLRNQ